MPRADSGEDDQETSRFHRKLAQVISNTYTVKSNTRNRHSDRVQSE